jgi:hypothetical protein
MKRRALLGPLVIAAALAAPALAVTRHAELDRVASIFAMRPVKASCYLAKEPDSPWSRGNWGHIDATRGARQLANETVLHLDSRICVGALRVNDSAVPAWQRSLGVLVLVHEAYHLRRWGAAGSEAKVECKAIRHWKVAARLFGATDQTVAELWPHALTHHYEVTSRTSVRTGDRPYYDPSCQVPPLMVVEEDEGA